MSRDVTFREQIFPSKGTTIELKVIFFTQMLMTAPPDFLVTHESGAVSYESYIDIVSDTTQPANNIQAPGDFNATEAAELENTVEDTSIDIPTRIENADEP